MTLLIHSGSIHSVSLAALALLWNRPYRLNPSRQRDVRKNNFPVKGSGGVDEWRGG